MQKQPPRFYPRGLPLVSAILCYHLVQIVSVIVLLTLHLGKVNPNANQSLDPQAHVHVATLESPCHVGLIAALVVNAHVGLNETLDANASLHVVGP